MCCLVPTHIRDPCFISLILDIWGAHVWLSSLKIGETNTYNISSHELSITETPVDQCFNFFAICSTLKNFSGCTHKFHRLNHFLAYMCSIALFKRLATIMVQIILRMLSPSTKTEPCPYQEAHNPTFTPPPLTCPLGPNQVFCLYQIWPSFCGSGSAVWFPPSRPYET